jgi:hypothetical protein
MRKSIIDLGEYKVVINYDDSGNGHLVVTVLDELDGEIETIEIENGDEDVDE